MVSQPFKQAWARFAVLVAALASASCSLAVEPVRVEVPPRFADAARSPEELADRLLGAIATNDEAALNKLRVSESEYRSIIVPGTVQEGQPRRVADAKTTDVFWRMLDTKSRDFGRLLLGELGGHTLVRDEIRFAKSGVKYQGYRTLGQLRVMTTDKDGARKLVRSGTVAELDGDYKLIGLNWND